MDKKFNTMNASKNFSKRIHLMVAIVALLVVSTSCSDEEEPEKHVLALSETSINVSKSSSTATIAVTTSEPWGAVPDDDETWCSLTLSETRLIVHCTTNNTGSTRSANIKVSTAYLHKYLTVKQSKK